MKIFYSWQSDTPSAIGKSLIRAALDEAVNVLAGEMELSEAERPQVDQDTQGVLGSPGVAETIFEKIRDANVVVLDVTLTGQTPVGKKLLNSNVAYELGYAHGHHGDRVLLKVMNTHFGGPEQLPFDLQHRRWPVRFSLAPDADAPQRKAIRQSLAKELAVILREYAANQPAREPYEPVASTANIACYWRADEKLVRGQMDRDEGKLLDLGYSDDEPLTFLRMWPDEALPEFSGDELSDFDLTIIQPLLGRTNGYDYTRNRYGALSYSGGGAGYLIASTQVFRNREIWGVERFILQARQHASYEFNFVPLQAFEEGMLRSMKQYLRAAARFGYGDIVNVEGGMVNVDDFRLAMPSNYVNPFWGPIFENVVSARTTLNRTDEMSINNALVKIFSAVFDQAGAARPRNLHGFPGDS